MVGLKWNGAINWFIYFFVLGCYLVWFFHLYGCDLYVFYVCFSFSVFFGILLIGWPNLLLLFSVSYFGYYGMARLLLFLI